MRHGRKIPVAAPDKRIFICDLRFPRVRIDLLTLALTSNAMPLSLFWFIDLIAAKRRKRRKEFVFCDFCAFLQPFSGGAGAG